MNCLRKVLKSSAGFTLIELVMIIVLLGILLPVALLPFITATKGITVPSNISKIAYVNRAQLSAEMERIDGVGAWPIADANGQYTLATIATTVDGTSYSTVIQGQFVDSAGVNTNGVSPNNKYLWITSTTTRDGTSDKVVLQVLKTEAYQ